MLSVVDERFVEQAKRFSLRFTCESCAHYDPDTGGCGNGYPNQPHRAIEIERVRELAFCKEFELS